MHTLHIYHLFIEYKHDIILLTESIYEHCMVLNSKEVESIGIGIVFTRSFNTLCSDVRCDFALKTMFDSSWLHFFCKGFMFYLLLVFMNVYRCPKRSPYQMMFVSFNTGFVTILTRRVPLVEHELLTLPVHLNPAGFSGVLLTRSLVLSVCFVDGFLSCCPFFFWPLRFLSFIDLRIFITSYASSSSS